jgi:hypothetical protein
MITIPPPVDAGRDTKRRREARTALAAVIWDDDGARRLPRERDLVAAIEACDPRDVWWTCEASSAGPVYLLPTREWIAALAQVVDALKAKSVLEIAAGDGFLSACLRRARPKRRVVATDDHSWTKAQARSNAADRRAYGATPFAGIRAATHVQKRRASTAVAQERPDLVLVAWAPPGLLVERAIRGPCRYVLDVSVDGDVCGAGMRTWRFAKEFLDGAIEERALCRLDARPSEARATRVTLYYGARHPRHGLE